MVEISLRGKVAILTGAGRGIGRATALKFADAGADVIIVDINKENAESVAKEAIALGVKSVAYDTDVTDADAMYNMVDEVVSKFGKLDIMFNNAGCNVITKFVDSTLDQMKWLMNVNFFGVYNGCKAAVKHMVRQKDGVILNTSSCAGVVGSIDHTPYTPTKFAIRGLTQTMARELGEDNIRVNAIAPGVTTTEMWEQNLREYVVGEGESEEETKAKRQRFYEDMIRARTILNRALDPDDIANACVFLVSDLAKNVTGQTWLVNGGLILS